MEERVAWNVKRDLGLCLRFPTNGEPVTKYAEENRQDRIRVDNDIYYKNGWLPYGPEGWWRFKTPESDELVVDPFAGRDIIIRYGNGETRKLVWDD